jgi:hypothetical protein
VLGDVAEPTTLGDQSPGGPQYFVQASEEMLVIQYPVEGRGREDQVNPLLDLQLRKIGDEIGRPLSQPLPRLRHHRLGGIDGEEAALR